MSEPVILVVDDEEELREILTVILEKMPCKVQLATNGSEGLHLVKSQNFDAVLSDINMPIMTGLDMISEIRNSGCNIPVVILTGYSEAEKIQRAKELGVIDYLSKPFRPQDILKVMQKTVQVKRS